MSLSQEIESLVKEAESVLNVVTTEQELDALKTSSSEKRETHFCS